MNFPARRRTAGALGTAGEGVKKLLTITGYTAPGAEATRRPDGTATPEVRAPNCRPNDEAAIEGLKRKARAKARAFAWDRYFCALGSAEIGVEETHPVFSDFVAVKAKVFRAVLGIQIPCGREPDR